MTSSILLTTAAAVLLPVAAGSAACSREPAPVAAAARSDHGDEAGAGRGMWPLRRPDGRFVVVDLDGRSVREVSAGPGALVVGHAFDPGRARLAFLLADGEVRVLDASSGKEIASLATGGGSVWVQHRLGFAGRGEVIVLASDAPAAEVWSLGTGTRLAELVLGGEGASTALAMDANGERVALGSSAGRIGVWSVRDGRRLHTAVVESAGVTVLAFDPAGETLAVGADDAVVRLWSLAGSEPTRVLSHRDADLFGDLAIGCVAFSPDGSRLVSASFPYWEARCWDVRRGVELWRYDGYRGGSAAPLGATFSPDGERVVLSRRGVVLDAGSGEVLRELVGEGSVSSDGETAWLEWTGCLHACSVETGERLFELDLEPRGR